MKSIADNSAVVGVIGLGYVGLPLVRAFCDRGFPVLAFDIDQDKVSQLNGGCSYLRHIPSQDIEAMVATGRFEATADFDRLADADAILICVPTPLTRYREPDMSYVEKTAESIAGRLRPGQLVVLESTTYPGTTEELVRPRLEACGLVCDRDFFLAYSPEREDPGNANFETTTIPKVVGGRDDAARELAVALYSRITEKVVPVSTLETAEAAKLLENIFRAVNIALVNELKIVLERMDIDVWEVIEAAKTKPFGFMPFYPGPGLGGHCIPIDPFYLTWKAREFDLATKFIELSGEINSSMPYYVVGRLKDALSRQHKKPLNDSRILVIGLAYKKNLDDTRESPSLKIISLLEDEGAKVDYYDPYVPEVKMLRDYRDMAGRRSIEWDAETLQTFDAAVICTDHDNIDYAGLAEHCRLVVDTRNATRALRPSHDNIVMA